MTGIKAGKEYLTSKDRPGLKALLVGVLVLLMTIPLFFIATINTGRQQAAEHVQHDVGYEWGGQAQTVAGPFLIIPFDRPTEVGDGEDKRMVTARFYVVVLPSELNVGAQIASQMRHRSIYEVPVFEADISAAGSFPAIDPSSFTEPGDVVRWEEAIVSLSLTDTRGIRSAIDIRMDERQFSFAPGVGHAVYGSSGVTAAVPGSYRLGQSELGNVEDLSANADPVNFANAQSFDLSFKLNGSTRLRFVPIGQITEGQMTADWQDPGFQGAFLPTDYSLEENGFAASWTVPNLARSFPDQFVITARTPSSQSEAFRRAAFGVDFVVPLDHYQKIFRALRYAVIFIGFTFLAFFLVELVLKTRLHPVQYLLIGAAQSVFYLLLLSASEHIGFGPAFTLAASATVALICSYGSFIARSLKVGAILLGVLGTIYFILYSLLQVEDLALLLGSMALFAALALTMLVTRNVNWYGEEKEAITGT